MNTFLRKMLNWRTGRQADKSDFTGPSVGQGSKKSNLEKRNSIWEEKNNRCFAKNMVHKSNIHYSEIYQKKTEKIYSLLNLKKINST